MSTLAYRYQLSRSCGQHGKTLVFIMLNPSTADDHLDDPTIRRCIGFARSHGYGEMQVLNLFALRATDPKVLISVAEQDLAAAIGKRDLMELLPDHADVCAAWGATVKHPALEARATAVARQLYARGGLSCLGVTKDGHPRHPLYLSNNARLSCWKPPFYASLVAAFGGHT